MSSSFLPTSVKFLLGGTAAVALLGVDTRPVVAQGANDLQTLKREMEQMRLGYQSRMKALEDRLKAAESAATAATERATKAETTAAKAETTATQAVTRINTAPTLSPAALAALAPAQMGGNTAVMPAGNLNQAGWFGTVEYRAQWGAGGHSTWALHKTSENGGEPYNEFEEERVSPGFGSGFRLGLGRQFGNNWDAGIYGAYQSATGKNSVSTNFDGNNDNPHLVSIGDDPDSSNSWQNGESRVRLRAWAFDLEGGYGWSPAAGTGLRVFGGLRAGRASNNIRSTFSGVFDSATCDEGGVADACSETNEIRSRFIGAGPRMGINGSFEVAQNIHVTGLLGASMLVGRTNTRYHQSFFVPQGNLGNCPGCDDFSGTSTTDFKQTRVVPVFEGQIGVTFGNIALGRMTGAVSVGYRGEVWVGATDQLRVTPNQGDSDGSFTATLEKANVGFHGPWVGGSIKF